MIPMRPCPDCSYPAAYDAFGNTDHVCMTGPRADMVNHMIESMIPKRDDDRVVIIESTADGISSGFHRAVMDGALYGRAVIQFLPPDE